MCIVNQDDLKRSGYWRRFVSGASYHMETPSADRVEEGEALVAMDEMPSKVRKPYTITKQREKWTEEEHQKFLEALKLYGRAWRYIEAHIGTKSAVQIRSHAQKFFSKLEKEASTGILAMMDQDLKIPPPRPKRKPGHPYPRKAEVLVRAGGFLIAGGEKHIESCEISTVSTGSQRGHSEDLLQPSRMATSLKLFGQTLLVQDLCTDDTLWPSEKKRAVYSNGLSQNQGCTFQSAPGQEEISHCRKIRNQTFSPEVSEIDTFQSGGFSVGRDPTHKSSGGANEQCSDAFLNSGHSSLSKEDEIESAPCINRFSRNYEEQNDNVQHWKKSQDSCTSRNRYFQKSHEEYVWHNSEVQMAFEALHQGLSSPNAKEMCFSVSDHCKILEHCRKTVSQNEVAIPLHDSISYNRLASQSNRSFGDLNRI